MKTEKQKLPPLLPIVIIASIASIALITTMILSLLSITHLSKQRAEQPPEPQITRVYQTPPNTTPQYTIDKIYIDKEHYLILIENNTIKTIIKR